jgi:hypothetical protein
MIFRPRAPTLREGPPRQRRERIVGETQLDSLNESIVSCWRTSEFFGSDEDADQRRTVES